MAIKLPEPFGYFKAEPFGWTDCAEGDEGATALYDEAAMREAIAAAVAVEREACAKECDTIAKVSRMRLAGLLMGGQYNFEDGISEGADLCTQAIRARQPQEDALDAESWVSESIAKPIESDGEVFVRFSDGTFGTGWAAYWHGASNDFAQWCHPDPDEDRTVTHWMKPPTIDAAIAAAKENK